MLLYRLLCAFLMAWAISWSLGQEQAVPLLNTVPEMALLGPLAGAFVGFISLALRQGWGAIVAVANGIWAGALSILVAGTIHMFIKLTQAARDGVITDFDRFMIAFSDSVDPLIEQVVNLPLLIVSLGATAIVGVVTEFLHWVLVRFRRKSQRAQST